MIIDLENMGQEQVSPKELEKLLVENNPLTLQIPLPSINSSNSYLDITEDYLEASFILESLSKIADLSDLNMIWAIKYHPVYHVKLAFQNPKMLAEKLIELSSLFFYDDDEDCFVALREDVWEFRETLDEQDFKFPEVINDYYANLVTGAYYELESEAPDYLEGMLVKYPERKFGFWLTPLSHKIGGNCYLSVHSWIIPREIDMNSVYKLISGHNQNIEFLPCYALFVNQTAYVLNDSVIVYLPFSHFLKARACTSALIDADVSEIMYETMWLDRLFSYYSRWGNAFIQTNDQLQYLISEFDDIVVIQDKEYSYVLFNVRSLNQREKLNLYEDLSKTVYSLSHASGMHIDITCAWEKLSDEEFEQLCYDIIYYNPKFDDSTIKKMGKSRSRDGGRDIEVYTRPLPGYPAEKFIFQCKLLKVGTSLTSKKLGSVSDVIDQYGAHGYGVMTNVVIDSTLYDKFDGIQQNRGTKFEHWSGFELERFLVRHPNIKQRYFQNH